jgi:hypothetical protein
MTAAPTHLTLTLPLDRITLAHLVTAEITKAEALVNHLSPMLLAETIDAVAELKCHEPASAHAYFVAYLQEAAKVDLVTPAPAHTPAPHPLPILKPLRRSRAK